MASASAMVAVWIVAFFCLRRRDGNCLRFGSMPWLWNRIVRHRRGRQRKVSRFCPWSSPSLASILASMLQGVRKFMFDFRLRTSAVEFPVTDEQRIVVDDSPRGADDSRKMRGRCFAI